MSTVIKVENLSKQYRLGEIGTGTLSHDINRWWHKVRGKEDPYLKIGEANDRTAKGTSDYVWALQDINFEVKAGEVLGIIGRNGAGKSTLLKILSKTTTPTTGSIKVKGRIASLLEVGTGFHPELSGRDNIFLNGAILGMTKKEIKSKFDEIVDFAGVERYIDTPVKRYSSGMYVRLAFAVAAHLEPEILIVDEVLAVGDAEFQKKCLGKMKDVSVNDGRTVLFVSHNMAAVSTLCTNGVYLKNGKVELFKDSIDFVIGQYIHDGNEKNQNIWEGEKGDENVLLKKIQVISNAGISGIVNHEDIVIEIQFDVLTDTQNLVVGLHLHSSRGYELAFTGLFDKFITEKEIAKDYIIAKGRYTYQINIPANTLAAGFYSIHPNIGIYNVKTIISQEIIIEFEILNVQGIGRKFLSGSGLENFFRPYWHWKQLINSK